MKVIWKFLDMRCKRVVLVIEKLIKFLDSGFGRKN
jgi:hypothetical protein